MRELAASRMVKASAAWMAVDMLATWCVRKLWGNARPSPFRVLSVAPGRRVWRVKSEFRTMTNQLTNHDEPVTNPWASGKQKSGV